MTATRKAHAWTTAVLTAALVFTSAVSAAAAPAPTRAPEGAPATEVTSLVDPFVSTEDDFGQDLPGAQAPNSIVKINPMTTPDRSHSGYDYAEDRIAGFTHTNLDGVGGSGGAGDLLIVPTYVTYTERPDKASYAKKFSHDAEEASPGYYRVDLTTTTGKNSAISDAPGVGPIVAEATADVRTGQDRFTFPQAGTASLVFDVANNFTDRRGATLDVSTLPDGRAVLSGEVVGYFNGYEYRLFYYAETTAETTQVRTWGGDRALSPSIRHRDGTDIGSILDFDVEDGEQIGVKMAISTISADQARTDLGAEMGERGFDEVRADTLAAWERTLGRVSISTSKTSDPDGSLSRLFYTHLYRMLASPVNATSTSGTYRALDGTIQQAVGYTHYDGWGFWDDFRKYEVLAVAYPDLYADMAQSIVDLFRGFSATGAAKLGALTHAVPTVRFERAAIVIADAIEKGVQLDGLEEAWPGLKQEAAGRYADATNVRLGYIANEADETLGTAYDDAALSTIAQAMGHNDEAAAYLERATNWVNIFKKDAVELPDGTKVGLNTPRRPDGTFVDVDPERFEAGNLYQGTLWQYNWYVASDMGGMIEMMGGKKNTLAALGYMFGEQAPEDGTRMLHSNANEIDLQAPYLFNYVGAPSRTQYWVRNIYSKETWNRYIGTGSTSHAPSGGGEFTPPVKTKVYKLEPRGFLPTMDNDTGTMSSGFVAAALGLFPVQAGSDEYQIGTPMFERSTITYPTGRTFTISADGVSPDSFYIQSARLNGAEFDRTWVTHDQLMAGGELAFSMGSEASDWGVDSVAPPSLSDRVDSAVYDRDSALTLSSRVFIESAEGDGSIGNTLTLSLADGTFAGSAGTDLAAGGAITAKGVPAGLKLTAEHVNTTTVKLALAGNAKSSNPLDSIDDLSVTVTDEALAQRPPGELGALSVKVTFVGAALSADRTSMRADAEGAIDESVILTLNGARFAGADGRDLIADGDLALRELPAGLAAVAEKLGAGTVKLRVHGALAGTDGGRFVLGFADGAFEGVPASSIGGDGIGLSAFTISVDPQWRSRLSALYGDVRLVEKGSYASTGFASFQTARTHAKTLLDDPAAGEADLRAAYYALEKSVDGLSIAQSPYRRMQAESSDDWSGGTLARETGTDASGVALGNLGGVGKGSWISYGDVNFSEDTPKTFTIRYVNNSTRCAADAHVQLRLDAPDGPLVDTVELPATGSNWNAYATVEHTLSDSSLLAGGHTLYLVFDETASDNRPWIGNIDWMQFDASDAPALDGVRVEAEAFAATNGGGLKIENSVDDTGTSIGNVGGSWNGGVLTYENVDLTARSFSTLSVRYANNSGRTGPSALVEMRIDDPESAPIATIPLPATGTSWNAYRTATAGVPAGVDGTHTVYVTMRAETNSARPYVSNFDWFEFAGADFAELRQIIADAEEIEPWGDRYIPADFGVFEQSLRDARYTAEDTTSSQASVDGALRVLRSALEQLEWKVVRELAELVVRAVAIDTSGYTSGSVQTLTQAIAEASALTPANAHEEYESAYAALGAAIDRLAVPTVPGQPAAPLTTLNGPASATVTWEPPTDDGGEPVAEYIVTLRTATAAGAIKSVGAPERVVVFSDLAAGTTYTASVTAVNGIGIGAASPESEPFTIAEAPAPPVTDGDALPDDLQDRIAIGVVDGVVTVSGLDAEDWYFLHVYSTPRELGWFQAGADGGFQAKLPTDLAEGTHRLSVIDANGVLLGWTEFQVAPTEGGTTDPGGSNPVTDPGSWLSATGQGVPVALIVLAVLLLAGGAGIVIVRRRRSV